MSEKRYAVPEGMLKAAIDARYTGKPIPDLIHVDQVRVILEAAVRWQSENPRVPTFAQCRDMWAEASMQEDGTETSAVIAKWIRRMYLAPEPEVPEKIKDLLCGSARCDAATVEAYRRGKAGR